MSGSNRDQSHLRLLQGGAPSPTSPATYAEPTPVAMPMAMPSAIAAAPAPMTTAQLPVQHQPSNGQPPVLVTPQQPIELPKSAVPFQNGPRGGGPSPTPVPPLSMPLAVGNAAAAVPHNFDHSHMLGLSTLLVGASALIGIRAGGLYGGIAGSLFGGAASNALRAARYLTLGTAAGKKEALISGTYAVVTAGFAGWVAYKVDTKADKKKKGLLS